MENAPASIDPTTEVKAIGKVVEALEGLDDDAIRRVLGWAVKRYGVSSDVERPRRAARKDATGDGGSDPVDAAAEYKDLAGLHDAVSPGTEAEKVLVAGYWHQVLQKKENLDGQALNSDLKQLGHGVTNVTRAASSLIDAKPALMMQVKKTGSSKQARKQYRLTDAGIRKVREMLAKVDDSADEA